ncbi:MAG: ABC transporter ATP-binding protein [Lachnospiraceae bacterium]|nr:ABC transporter ATP-binding protein [Lachnospiraceae bacterium]
MSKLISVNQLEICIKQEKFNVVKNVGFSLDKGKALVILGQSGSGKTMTCHCLMGLLDPRKYAVSGEILYDGKNILKLSPKEKRLLYGGEIAFIPQNPMTALDPSMKIGKQITETLSLHSDIPKNERNEAALDALKKAGLGDVNRVFTSFPHELSGGMLQRVLIAMALMVNAKLVIADEPTTALDVVHRNETMEAFSKMLKAGTSVLMVTHDFAAALGLGGDLIIMHEGNIVETGTVTGVLSNPRHAYTRQLIDASVLTSGIREVAV